MEKEPKKKVKSQYFETMIKGIDTILSLLGSDDPKDVTKTVETLSTLSCKNIGEGIDHFLSRMRLWEQFLNTGFQPNNVNYIHAKEKFLFIVSDVEEPMTAAQWLEQFKKDPIPLGFLEALGRELLKSPLSDTESAVLQMMDNLDDEFFSDACKEDLKRLKKPISQSRFAAVKGLKDSIGSVAFRRPQGSPPSNVAESKPSPLLTERAPESESNRFDPATSLSVQLGDTDDVFFHQTVFPFLNSHVPPERYCSFIKKIELYRCMIMDCVGTDIEKINKLSYKEAWELCDNVYFIPMMDKRRAHYKHKTNHRSPIA